MSGRLISDKGGYAGTSDALMKSKTHLKEYHSADGAGGMKDYPDTTEHIKSDQEKGEGKVKGHSLKPGYRY